MNKNFLLFIFLFLFQLPSSSQNISQVDQITGSFDFDNFFINNLGERFYFLNYWHPNDTILVNDQLILGSADTCTPFYKCRDGAFLGLKDDGTLKFLKQDWAIDLLESDSTFFLINIFLEDTLFTLDTMYVKSSSKLGLGHNLIISEYDFNGNRIRSKHWTTPYDCRFRTNEVQMMNSDIFISGYFDKDTLKFDNQMLAKINKTDGFIGKINSTLECEWLRGFAGFDTDEVISIAVSNEQEVIAVGNYVSGELHTCDSTIINEWGWFSSNMFVAKYDSIGNCGWVTQVIDPGNEGGTGSDFLSDGSFVLLGMYTGWNANFGDTIIANPTPFNNGFIAKYDLQSNVQKIFQLEGNGDFQGMLGPVVSSNDNFWVCGNYNSNPLIIGDFELPFRNPPDINGHDAFVAKFDKNLNPLFAMSFGGEDHDYATDIQQGPDGLIYVTMHARSDTIDIGNQIYTKHPSFHTNVFVIEIQDTTTTAVNEIYAGNTPIKLYPNPVSSNSQLHFELSNIYAKKLKQIILYSIQGIPIRKFSSIQKGEGVLVLPDISSGVYFIEFDFEGWKVVERIVIQ